MRKTQTVTSDSLKGKPTLIYFGYTFCPDVCPTSLLLMETAVERFGRLDILIANAGNSHPATITDASADDWASTIAVHVNGTFNCIHHAAPLIAQQGGGTIITTGGTGPRAAMSRWPSSPGYRSNAQSRRRFHLLDEPIH